MKVSYVRSDDIYRKIMVAPAEKKNDIYRYELMMPFKRKASPYKRLYSCQEKAMEGKK